MNWQLQREMTGEQFVRVIAELKMSRAAVARFVGVTERQVRRYIAGQRTVPVTTALLLRSMLQHGDLPVVPKRPKGRSY